MVDANAANGESSTSKESNNSTSTPTTNDKVQSPPISHDAPKSTPEDSERIAIELEKPYLYQNRRTGQPSTSPLTARQLCRLLCPAVNGSIMRSSTMLVTPDTLVIGYDISTGQYSTDGWMAARKTPVLREACCSWHYEEDKGKIKGPVSCRDLSTAIVERRSKENKESVPNAWENVRVWSTEMAQLEKDADKDDKQQQQQQWRKISEIIFLKAAMEAFEDTPPPWELEGNNGDKKARQVDNAEGGHAAPTMMSPEGEFDPSVMTFDASTDISTTERIGSGIKQSDLSAETGPSVGGVTNAPSKNLSKSEAEELEAFLSSTANLGPAQGKGDDDDEEEGYESDGGTSYVKDPLTGNWIHAALAPPKPPKEDVPSNDKQSSTISTNGTSGKKRKRKKANFAAKNAKCWVYVTGLPKDTNEDEVATYFARVGVLDLDPSSQHPKVKLYREKDAGNNGGSLKGDASICYARPESVDMALQFLDDSPFRADSGTDRIKVQRAKFEQHGNQFHENKGRFSNAQRKVARLAALQAVGWDEGENGRITGGKKGLRIIVLKNMFHPDELADGGSAKEDTALMDLEREVHNECEKYGAVEKITVFSKNPSGVMVVKFTQPGAASGAISEYHGRTRKGRKVDASFWDGVTDYTVRDLEKEEKEMDQRHDEFGNWLESQEVPEEFQLKVEGDS